MSIVCSKTISAAIKKATGIDHIEVHKQEGVCHFFSDHEATSEFLPLHDFEAVYVYRMNHLTIDQWVEEFQRLLKEFASDERVKELLKLQGGADNV